eukprot:SAG31_NODE_15468_length_753_cov_1.574924_2_plen_38_part_01
MSTELNYVLTVGLLAKFRMSVVAKLQSVVAKFRWAGSL